MSTKIFDRNRALTSRTLLSLALMGTAPMKKTRRWIIEEAMVHRKDNDEGYSWRLKIRVLGLFGKMTQVNTFEELGGVVHRPQKNVKDDVKERWKNRLLQPGRLWICFQLS